METIAFTHKDQQYEVRIISNGDTIYIRVFKDNRPANGYTYQVEMPIAFDMKRILGVDAIKDLIETAKQDVIDGTWERLLRAFAEG